MAVRGKVADLDAALVDDEQVRDVIDRSEYRPFEGRWIVSPLLRRIGLACVATSSCSSGDRPLKSGTIATHDVPG